MKSSHALLMVAAFAVSTSAAAVDRRDAELELSQALTAVQAAEREDGARYAPGELGEAQGMLVSAQRAFDARAWTDTALYAERAKVSGDLTVARSRQHRAETATAEIERSVDALRVRLPNGGTP
ncbi:MAG: DUF4398 domain-containing protein [Rhodanobacteraceae bacterium]